MDIVADDGALDALKFDELDVARQFLLLSQVVVRHESRALQGLSLSYRQLRTLRHIAAGVHSATELGRLFGITPPAMSETIDALVKRGLLLRTQNEKDRRAVKLVLTEAGMSVVEDGERARLEKAEALLDPLTSEQREVFGELVAALYRPAKNSLLDQRMLAGDEGSP